MKVVITSSAFLILATNMKTTKYQIWYWLATTKEIDLILGGHTHTFLKEPTQVKTRQAKRPSSTRQDGPEYNLAGSICILNEIKKELV